MMLYHVAYRVFEWPYVDHNGRRRAFAPTGRYINVVTAYAGAFFDRHVKGVGEGASAPDPKLASWREDAS